MFRLLLVVPDAELLKEDVGAIKDRASVPRTRASLAQEVVQDFPLDLPPH